MLDNRTFISWVVNRSIYITRFICRSIMSSSPSSSKVDDFLLLLSLLSQQRLLEDSQRQRQLQRNIDELRLKLNQSSPIRPQRPSKPIELSLGDTPVIPLLKFKRDMKRDLTIGPAFPKRPSERESTPPPTPKRPVVLEDKYEDDDEEQGPPLPIRRVTPREEFGINLVTPIASKKAGTGTESNNGSYNDKDNRTKTSIGVNSNKTSDFRSFRSMESSIKTSGASTLGIEAKFKNKPPVPQKLQPDWISSTLNSKMPSTNQAQSIVKPLQLAGMAAAGSANHLTYDKPSFNKSTSSNSSFIPKHNNPSDIKIVQLSPKRGSGNMSWLDSAVSKSPEQPKRHFIIPKKPNQLRQDGNNETSRELAKAPPPKPVKPANAALEALEKLRKSPSKSNPVEVTNDRAEFLKKFSEMKKSSLTPSLSMSLSSPFRAKNYENTDTIELKEQLAKAKSKAVPAVPKKINYEKRDSELLRGQMQKLNSSRKVEIVREIEPEGLMALGKLKPTKTPIKPVAPKPEALKKFESIEKKKEAENVPQQMAGSTLKEEVSFQDKLSSILRTNSAPIGGMTTVNSTPNRASTFTDTKSIGKEKRINTKGGKMTHANKSRAKGPKRRLPKAIGNTNEKTASTTPINNNNVDNIATSTTVEKEVVSLPETMTEDKLEVKKKPPPINRERKKNAIENLKPSRSFSGELFI